MRYLLIFLFLFICLSCQNKREFDWSEELEQMTNKNLAEWIEKSPFNGKWNTNKTSKAKIFITNNDIIYGYVVTDTETYFKENSYLKIQIKYPEYHAEAKKELLDILTSMKIRKY